MLCRDVACYVSFTVRERDVACYVSTKHRDTMPGPQSANLNAAVDAALRGATVITANARAARAVRRACDLLHLASKSWTTADALPFDAWIARTWTDALAAGIVDRPLLRPMQQSALWQSVVGRSRATRDLLSAGAAALAAERAWQTLLAYEIPFER